MIRWQFIRKNKPCPSSTSIWFCRFLTQTLNFQNESYSIFRESLQKLMKKIALENDKSEHIFVWLLFHWSSWLYLDWDWFEESRHFTIWSAPHFFQIKLIFNRHFAVSAYSFDRIIKKKLNDYVYFIQIKSISLPPRCQISSVSPLYLNKEFILLCSFTICYEGVHKIAS